MKQLKSLVWILSTGAAMALVAVVATRGDPLSADAWLPLASPGPLSKAHAFLAGNCASCHQPYAGVAPTGCIACHADSKSLLGREPTAFHGRIGSCRECHSEHGGADSRPTVMDHAALAAIGLRDAERESPARAGGLQRWLKAADRAGPLRSGAPLLAPAETLLDCAACHATKDRHLGQMGADCASCHATTSWRIPGYRHPSPSSTDCGECHLPPPSHSMMHFEMMSKTIARQPNARVEQCEKCHQTTAWNDIRGVGWYKHH